MTRAASYRALCSPSHIQIWRQTDKCTLSTWDVEEGTWTGAQYWHQDSIWFGPEVHSVLSQSALQSRKCYLCIQCVQGIQAPDVVCCVVSHTVYSVALGAWGWHETAVWYFSRLQHTLYVTLQGLCLPVWKIFKFSESISFHWSDLISIYLINTSFVYRYI